MEEFCIASYNILSVTFELLELELELANTSTGFIKSLVSHGNTIFSVVVPGFITGTDVLVDFEEAGPAT